MSPKRERIDPMGTKRKGILFVISAPSGAGKTTLIGRVVRVLQGLSLSVSCTTRRPRPGEVHGKDYFFISMEEFQDMADKKMLLEWAMVHGMLYGTPASNLKVLDEGDDLVLDIDTQGATLIKRQIPDGVFIYIMPPSLKTLEDRLRARGGDSEEAVAIRLRNAEKELDHAGWYDYIIINKDIDEASKALQSIIIAERSRAHRVLAS